MVWAAFKNRLAHAWNAFTNLEERIPAMDLGGSYGSRPDRVRLFPGSERSIIASILARIAVDASGIDIRHVRLDEKKRYLEDVDSGLNNCLTVEANLDQAATMFRRDAFLTLLDTGVIAIVPVDTTVNPAISAGFDVKTMRVGRIVQWFPRHVRVDVYNENTGRREEVTLEKKFVSIVENPLYAVMNEPNSTLQRLIRKLNLLDTTDELIASGKLDLIIQLPYVVKSEGRRKQAEQRRKDVEFQLKGSQYGIAYTDGTEKITQLNRPAENNLLKQVEYLTAMLYTQLGLTEGVMNGTATEKEMKNYLNRTIKPLLTAVVEAMRRTLLSKTARSQKQTVMFFHDVFELASLEEIAEIADKLIRNEVATGNEMRGVLGLPPVRDPKADQLRNPNMPEEESIPSRVPSPSGPDPTQVMEGVSQNGRR
jgi:hypothetical protein